MPEEYVNSNLFSLSIDDVAQGHLLAIAKWNKFVAIAGISVCSVVTLMIIYMLSARTVVIANIYIGQDPFEILFYIVFLAIFFIPCIFQLKFANKMMLALAAKDQALINESLTQAKNFSKYWGIVAIIFVLFSVAGFLFFLGSLIA